MAWWGRDSGSPTPPLAMELLAFQGCYMRNSFLQGYGPWLFVMLLGGWCYIYTCIGSTNWPHWIIKRGLRGLGGVKIGSGWWILLKYTICLWNSQGIKKNNNNKDIKCIPFFKCQGCIILSFKYKLAISSICPSGGLTIRSDPYQLMDVKMWIKVLVSLIPCSSMFPWVFLLFFQMFSFIIQPFLWFP